MLCCTTRASGPHRASSGSSANSQAVVRQCTPSRVYPASGAAQGRAWLTAKWARACGQMDTRRRTQRWQQRNWPGSPGRGQAAQSHEALPAAWAALAVVTVRSNLYSTCSTPTSRKARTTGRPSSSNLACRRGRVENTQRMPRAQDLPWTAGRGRRPRSAASPATSRPRPRRTLPSSTRRGRAQGKRRHTRVRRRTEAAAGDGADDLGEGPSRAERPKEGGEGPPKRSARAKRKGVTAAAKDEEETPHREPGVVEDLAPTRREALKRQEKTAPRSAQRQGSSRSSQRAKAAAASALYIGRRGGSLRKRRQGGICQIAEASLPKGVVFFLRSRQAP